jgi:hypothetical protein
VHFPAATSQLSARERSHFGGIQRTRFWKAARVGSVAKLAIRGVQDIIHGRGEDQGAILVHAQPEPPTTTCIRLSTRLLASLSKHSQ